MTAKPIWRCGVEVVESVAAPTLERATNHEIYGLGVSATKRARRAVLRRTERLSRKVLHGLNLPTASDVNRLLRQIRTPAQNVEHQRGGANLQGAERQFGEPVGSRAAEMTASESADLLSRVGREVQRI